MMKDKSRLDHPLMTHYRDTYKDSPVWDGKETGKKLIVYCEGSFGDIIQFARYFKHTNNHVILHCPKHLHRLFSEYELFDKESSELPNHDYHIPSMSLPFVLDKTEVEVPYIFSEKADVGLTKKLKIGIAWEGNPLRKNNIVRCCPLHCFKTIKNATFFMMQDKIYLKELLKGCEDFDLSAMQLNDFKDTAALMAAMDMVISVDTAALHLAGAMGKKGFGILADSYDERWKVCNWYPSIKLLQGHWYIIFDKIAKTITSSGLSNS